jgi:hypothetical protein
MGVSVLPRAAIVRGTVPVRLIKTVLASPISICPSYPGHGGHGLWQSVVQCGQGVDSGESARRGR